MRFSSVSVGCIASQISQPDKVQGWRRGAVCGACASAILPVLLSGSSLISELEGSRGLGKSANHHVCRISALCSGKHKLHASVDEDAGFNDEKVLIVKLARTDFLRCRATQYSLFIS